MCAVNVEIDRIIHTIPFSEPGKLVGAVSVQGRAFVTLNFHGILVHALLDTGAARSILRNDVFIDIFQRTRRAPLVRQTQQLQTVSGQTLGLNGETDIDEAQAGPLTLVIAANISQPAIIGDDMLRKGKAFIDYSTGTFTWFATGWQLHHEQLLTEVGALDPIDAIVRRFTHVFTGTKVGFCPLIEVQIAPIYQRPYRTPLHKRELIETEVADMLRQDIIQPSNSPWASPVTLVPKKDGSIRFCVDFRKLNHVTKKDRYPLPLIQDIFDQLAGASVFSTLDLKSGYWQVPIAEQDREKTAFICHLGLFEFTRLPFGLANGPAVFQRLVNKVLAGLIGTICMVYIDDIVIYSHDVTAHAKHLQLVLQRLEDAGLTLKRSKCVFGLTEVDLLGYKVGMHGLRPDPEKVKAIRELGAPGDKTEVRSFLGMTGYYRQCIPEYARIAEPLQRLTHKHTRFKWSPAEQRVFDDLKNLLTSDAVMAHPNLRKPYKLYTDACDYAIGGILVQVDDNSVERVIQYISHQLSGSQLRWATIEKEAYAV